MSTATIWHQGDAEPGEEVRAVRYADIDNGVLFKHDHSWGWTAAPESGGDGRPYDWNRLLRGGALVDATHENPPPLSVQILDRLNDPQTPEEQSAAHDALRAGLHGMSYGQLQKLADQLGIER